jgi:hypothetical protein
LVWHFSGLEKTLTKVFILSETESVEHARIVCEICQSVPFRRNLLSDFIMFFKKSFYHFIGNMISGLVPVLDEPNPEFIDLFLSAGNGL